MGWERYDIAPAHLDYEDMEGIVLVVSLSIHWEGCIGHSDGRSMYFSILTFHMQFVTYTIRNVIKADP